MAKGKSGRRYARDARGRFASTGTTAKGGRLKGGTAEKKRIGGSDLNPATAKPSGTVSGSSRGRVIDRANRMKAAGDNKMGLIPRARKSLNKQAAAVRGGRTRKANLDAMPLSKRSKSYQAKRAKAGIARFLSR